MITNVKYEDLIRNGERVQWYGVKVPRELITNLVSVWSDNLKKEIDELESTTSDLKGISLDNRKGYIKGLTTNLQNAPYTLNGDTYLKKKLRIETQIDKESKKKPVKKKRKTSKKKTTKQSVTTSNKVTKNSNTIFGKNKK